MKHRFILQLSMIILIALFFSACGRSTSSDLDRGDNQNFHINKADVETAEKAQDSIAD